MNTLKIEDLITLQNKILSTQGEISHSPNEITFHFNLDKSLSELKEVILRLNIGIIDENPKSLTIEDNQGDIILFENLISCFDKLDRDITILETKNIFVFDEKGDYIFYEFNSRKTFTNSKYEYLKFAIDNFSQRKILLEIFLDLNNKIIEFKRSRLENDELIIASNIDKKALTIIEYKTYNSTKLNYFILLPLLEFKNKISSDDWLACFKNTICEYLHLQQNNKSFDIIYTNFNYILNLTEKNFQLYISKFSFDKIRKQFRVEKNSYFEGLNTAQNKISNQIISIPISLGASIYSFFQLEADFITLILIYSSVIIYIFFITYVIIMNLYDIRKIDCDSKEEEGNMKNHYPDLLIDYAVDFRFMRNKIRRIYFLAWAIILALVITIILITIFIFEEKNIQQNFLHFIAT